jgi:hypothetical protein
MEFFLISFWNIKFLKKTLRSNDLKFKFKQPNLLYTKYFKSEMVHEFFNFTVLIFK